MARIVRTTHCASTFHCCSCLASRCNLAQKKPSGREVVYGIGSAWFCVTSRDNVKRRTLQTNGNAKVVISESRACTVVPQLDLRC